VGADGPRAILTVDLDTHSSLSALTWTAVNGFTPSTVMKQPAVAAALGHTSSASINDVVALEGPGFLRLYVGDGLGGFTAQQTPASVSGRRLLLLPLAPASLDDVLLRPATGDGVTVFVNQAGKF
jgi:hypothetical protein